MAINEPGKLLDRLLAESGEQMWLEFKVNNDNVEEMGEYVSALANSAMLCNRDRAFLVFGIEDKTRKKVGTNVRLGDLKKGGENFQNWISRLLEPRLLLEFVDFSYKSIPISILCIEPSYDRPVSFSGVEYIRIGQNKRKLKYFPNHERSLWLATGRRTFEHSVALSGQYANGHLEQ
jgi:predicted HTH transcriptional regulator